MLNVDAQMRSARGARKKASHWRNGRRVPMPELPPQLSPDVTQLNPDLGIPRTVGGVSMDGVQESPDPGYDIVPCRTDGEGGTPLPDCPIHLPSSKRRRKEMRSVPGPQEDPYDLNKLVEAIVQESSRPHPEPTLQYLQALTMESNILISESPGDRSAFAGVTYEKRSKHYQGTLWFPKETVERGRQLFTGSFLKAEAAARSRDLLIIKGLMCGVRWSYSHTLNFPMEEYLEELRKPRVMAMTDVRQYRLYLVMEIADVSYRSHVDGFNGVFWNKRTSNYEAFVWDSVKGKYSKGKLWIHKRKSVLMDKFEFQEEAAIAHDKEAIRIGAWRDQILNNPVTNYVADLVSSPFVQDYIRSLLGHTNSSCDSQLLK